MADDPTPTTLRRQLGARLRQLRQDRNETAQQVADALGFSVSKVSRMESGARAVKEQDIAALVDYFALDGGSAREVVELARGGRRRRASIPYPVAELEHLNMVQSGFVELEQDAERVREYNSGIVPGLLQTSDYMRCVMESAISSDQEFIERAIELRTRRQRRLDTPGSYEIVIDEAVLARVVGDVAVMDAQVTSMMARLDAQQADIRVIPFVAGVHAGLNSMFVALTMAGPAVPDTVFMEGLAGHQKIDRHDEVQRLDDVWSELVASASSRAESREILESYAQHYRRMRDERSAATTNG